MASDIPIADLANNLYHKLDRNKIFPPYHNKPEDLLPILNASRKCRPRRSPNSFLLCRKNVHEEAKRNGTFNMRIISKVTGMLWRDASPREKQFYEDLFVTMQFDYPPLSQSFIYYNNDPDFQDFNNLMYYLDNVEHFQLFNDNVL
ncbi:7111_t:CDS:2 [Gigaspora rosea]|nr:7111_t:CDS:2 [Gigaspora rosea]